MGPTWGIPLTFPLQICVVLVCVLKGHMTGTDGALLTGGGFGLWCSWLGGGLAVLI